MAQDTHYHDHHHGPGDAHEFEAGHAELLDMDAVVFGSLLGDITKWAAQLLPDRPRKIIDLGAGTGTGSLALARRFDTAEVVAIDLSAPMLEHLRAAARIQDLDHRVRVVLADLDAGWPDVGAADLAWAASSLHHFRDPDRLLRDVYAALNPGGLLLVIEMDALPRFLPDDLGFGSPGLEARCHRVAAENNWNAHPDWRPHLGRAGFEIAGQRTFAIEEAVTPTARRYAQSLLSRFRAFTDELSAADLDSLDLLLADDHPGAVAHRNDLTVHSSRTVWAARRGDYSKEDHP